MPGARGPPGKGLDIRVVEYRSSPCWLPGQSPLARLPPNTRAFTSPGPSVRLSVRPSVPCSSCWGVQALSSQPFYLSGFLLGSFWWYPNFLGLTQRKKHFVKIAALLLNNLSSYSLFLFGRQKLNIDLWEREKRGSQGRGVEGQRGSRGGGCGRAGKRSAGRTSSDLGPGCFCHKGTSSLPVPQLLGPGHKVPFNTERKAPLWAPKGDLGSSGLTPEIRHRLHSGGSWTLFPHS